MERVSDLEVENSKLKQVVNDLQLERQKELQGRTRLATQLSMFFPTPSSAGYSADMLEAHASVVAQAGVDVAVL